MRVGDGKGPRRHNFKSYFIAANNLSYPSWSIAQTPTTGHSNGHLPTSDSTSRNKVYDPNEDEDD